MNPQESKNDLRIILRIITSYYWVFLISGLLSLAIAYFYNKYSPKRYNVVASILINEDESSLLSGPQEFMVSDLFGADKNVYNELLVLQSKPILEKTIQNLDLEVAYFERYDYAYHNIYKQSPFRITFYRDHPQLVNVMFNISFNPDGSYLLEVDKQNALLYDFIKDRVITETDVSELKLQGNLGQIVETDQYKFIISLNEDIDEIPMKDNQYAFRIQNHISIESYYKGNIEFMVADRNATVINIRMETSNVDRDVEVMNELIRVYAESNLDRKNHIANLTIDYIEKQLEEVAQSLDITESELEEFLSKNKLINVESQANLYTDQLRELQDQLATNIVQKRYFDYASEYLKEQSNDEELIIAPSAMGVEDALLNQIIMELSSAQSRKANLIENNQERNPLVERLTIQIENLKAVVAESIRSANESNDISINELEKRISQIENEISSLPEAQRTLGGIERNYQLNDAIYTYLLQKRAEARITRASNLPDMTIVQPAAQDGTQPVAPKSFIIYSLALLLGLGIPFVPFYIFALISNTKIKTTEDLQNLTNSRVLGIVLHLPSKYMNKNVFMQLQRDKSNYAEAYRTIYTNLNFLLKDKKNKTILVTSSVTGEGKTFNSLNIAAAYASMKIDTVLVNCDLHKYDTILDTKNSNVGLSVYLSGDITIDQLIQPTDMTDLFYIPPGTRPLNTVELLSSTPMEELMAYLKEHFDCIILDSSPLAHVSDAYYLIKYADISLIVTRYELTRKKILLKVLKDLESKGVHNLGLILNDNRNTKEQFGYGYGYYGKEKKKKPSKVKLKTFLKYK